ncbi:MAG: CHASE3 domain-containing protein [Gallionella sp.]|nr:CHASE3 domain-containing protein [Gallionella sp.]
MKWSIEHKVLTGFAVALAILAAIGWLAYQSTVSFMHASTHSMHSQETITALEEIFSLTNQAETRQRIYLISGDERHLAPRRACIDRIHILLGKVRDATADNPGQQALLRRLDEHIDARLALLEGVLKVRHEQSFEQARLKLMAGDGEREMDAIHETVEQLQKEEAARLQQWADVSRANADRMLTTFIAALVSVAIFFGVLFLFIVRELAERKQAEEQRALLMHELESANEELKNFGYVVSHDLKAPLRAIGSLANWLSTDYADKFDDEGKEHMRLLISRVYRMDGLIDGILQYSRVGRVKETIIAVDLDRLVHEVIDLLAPPPSIVVSIENQLPTVMTEPTRIQQVFQNLLSNAIKYMDKPEGEIRIACVAEGRQWKFSITDNGPGIDQQHFEKIFQLFQTLAPRDRVESTGVGLALVKKIVEMYGGRIWLESTVKRGSTFFFTLPRTAANAGSNKGTQA